MNAAQRLLRIGRNTANLDRAIAFYCDALGFHVDAAAQDPMPAWARFPGACARLPRVARLVLGAQQIDLMEFADAAPYPIDSTACDLWFQHCAVVVSDIDTACRRTIRKGATPITQGGPQTLPPATGSVTAFKFRDPDGHPLELIHFPPGTGDPAWQRAPTDPGHCTLGIDHSAISVGDVAASIAFYQRLGFRVAARGVNRGIGQQQLDDLDDVVVEVVALEPADARTPHLELLGYRTPHGRKPAHVDIHDIAADRLVLRIHDLHVAARSLPTPMVKPAVLGTTRSTGDLQTILLHDPDGHWLVLV